MAGAVMSSAVTTPAATTDAYWRTIQIVAHQRYMQYQPVRDKMELTGSIFLHIIGLVCAVIVSVFMDSVIDWLYLLFLSFDAAIVYALMYVWVDVVETYTSRKLWNALLVMSTPEARAYALASIRIRGRKLSTIELKCLVRQDLGGILRNQLIY